MLRQALDGHWRVTWKPYGSTVDPFLAAHFVPEGWLDAVIPEDIHATLRRAGLVRGHFMGKDPAEDQWIEDADWIYYKEFFADKPFYDTKVTLDFDGLDTLCDLYLNGERIGSTRNMFLGYSFDVTDSLRYASRNVLIVHIRSAVKSVTGESRENLFSSNAYDRLFLRKAQMNFAWDFCGRYVTAGIWKSVSLQSFDHNRISRWYFTTRKITSEAADIQLDVAITEDMEPLGTYAVRIELLEGETPVFQKTGDAQEMAYTRFSIPHPRLWQPMPNGDPYLYQLRITLLRNGNIIEQISRKAGIRTVRVVQEPQEDGTSFLFEVNGRKLFARGANWVPLNVLYTDIRAADYQRALCYAVHGNINMLRVWGGGIYEYDCFYDLCDQYGILVCQDFMLACGIYPQSGAFLDNLAEEADYNILKLRNHACLAAWMGDNENDIAYGWGNRAHDFRSDKLNRGILLEACARLDPERFYMPSSPCSPFAEAEGGDTPNAACQGDTHLYLFSLDPQSEKFYRNVRDIRPRFVSEFGFLSFPDRETYFRFNFFRKQPAMLEPSLPSFPSPEA
ncbi:MAG: sugar-binding domain-containing protein, partial [Bacillota bacterium]